MGVIATFFGSFSRAIFYSWLGNKMVSENVDLLELAKDANLLDDFIGAGAKEFNAIFYTIIIVMSVLFIVYSYIIQPYLLKKSRAIKKAVKGQKSISEALLYPSKGAYIVKKFGDKWGKLGLSLEEILGIKSKVKKEKLSMGLEHPRNGKKDFL